LEDVMSKRELRFWNCWMCPVAAILMCGAFIFAPV